MCFLGWRRRNRSNDAPELLAVDVCLYILYTYLYTEEIWGEPKPITPLSNTRGQHNLGEEESFQEGQYGNTCQTLGCLEIHCHFPVLSVPGKMWALGDLLGQRSQLHSCSSSSLSGPQANCRALNLCCYSTLRMVLKVLPLGELFLKIAGPKAVVSS